MRQTPIGRPCRTSANERIAGRDSANDVRRCSCGLASADAHVQSVTVIIASAMPALAHGPVVGHPFLSCRWRALEPLRSTAKRQPCSMTKQATSSPGLGCEVGIGMGNVGHEGLLASR